MLAGNIPLHRSARIGVSSFFFISGLCFASWATRIPDIQKYIGLSKAELGTVLFASPVGSMICLPLAGFLVTKFGSRNVLLMGTFIYACNLCLLGIVDTFWKLITVLFFFGMSGNLMNISVNTQAVGVEAVYKRSIMASFHGLWSLGGVAGTGIGYLMISHQIQPLQHFTVIATMMIATFLYFFRFTLKGDKHNAQKQKFTFEWSNIKAVMVLGIVAFCCMGCEGCMFDWSGIYFRDVVQVPTESVTVGLNVFMATMATGRFISDAMVTKFGTIRVLQASGTLITAGLLTAVIFPNIYAATFGFFLTGFGVSSVVPLSYGLAGKSTKLSAGIAISLVSSVGFLGFLFGPPIIGYIAEALSLQWSFGLMAVIGFGTAVLASHAKVE